MSNTSKFVTRSLLALAILGALGFSGSQGWQPLTSVLISPSYAAGATNNKSTNTSKTSKTSKSSTKTTKKTSTAAAATAITGAAAAVVASEEKKEAVAPKTNEDHIKALNDQITAWQTEVTTLEASKGASPAAQASIDAYNKAIDFARQAIAQYNALEQAIKNIEQMPSKNEALSQLVAEINEQLANDKEPLIPEDKESVQVSINTLADQIAANQTQLNSISQPNTTLATEVQKNNQRLIIISNALNSGDNLSQSGIASLKAEQQYLTVRNLVLNRQINAQTLFVQNADLQKQLYTARSELFNYQLNVLKEAYTNILNAEQEKLKTSNPIVAQEVSINQDLLTGLSNMNKQSSTLESLLTKRKEQLEVAKTVSSTIDSQISLLQGTLELNRLISEQKKFLPDISKNTSLNTDIINWRVASFQLLGRQQAIKNPDDYIAAKIKANPSAPELTKEEEKVLDQVLNQRQQLINDNITAYNTAINSATEIDQIENQLVTIITNINNKLNQQDFFVRSTPNINLSWIQNLHYSIQTQIKGIASKLTVQFGNPIYYGLGLILILASFLISRQRPRIINILARLRDKVNVRSQDGILVTPAATFLTFWTDVNKPLLMGGITLITVNTIFNDNNYIVDYFYYSFFFLTYYTFAYNLLRRGGVMSTHFSPPGSFYAKQSNQDENLDNKDFRVPQPRVLYQHTKIFTDSKTANFLKINFINERKLYQSRVELNGGVEPEDEDHTLYVLPEVRKVLDKVQNEIEKTIAAAEKQRAKEEAKRHKELEQAEQEKRQAELAKLAAESRADADTEETPDQEQIEQREIAQMLVDERVNAQVSANAETAEAEQTANASQTANISLSPTEQSETPLTEAQANDPDYTPVSVEEELEAKGVATNIPLVANATASSQNLATASNTTSKQNAQVTGSAVNNPADELAVNLTSPAPEPSSLTTNASLANASATATAATPALTDNDLVLIEEQAQERALAKQVATEAAQQEAQGSDDGILESKSIPEYNQEVALAVADQARIQVLQKAGVESTLLEVYQENQKRAAAKRYSSAVKVKNPPRIVYNEDGDDLDTSKLEEADKYINLPSAPVKNEFKKQALLNADVRGLLRRSKWQIFILVNVMFFNLHPSVTPSENIIGQILYISTIFSIWLWNLLYIRKAFFTRRKNGTLDTQFKTIAAIYFLVPITLIALTANGYVNTTTILLQHGFDTFYASVLLFVVARILTRTFAIASLRSARRQITVADITKQIDNTQPIENIYERERQIKIQVHNERRKVYQSIYPGFNKLANVISGLTAITVIFLVWNDLMSVVNYLNNVTVWQVSGAVSGTLDDITLFNILKAIALLIGTSLVYKNLKPLLDILVFSKLQLSEGLPFAIQTVLSYLIIAFGCGSAFSSLGMSWSNLQWLFSALLVGLGFGLQEIFGNFVSGIIILFERPIRINDYVTINGVNGQVKDIRIRATTIIDPDNKEIIIPNKTFITGTFTNWSLSDSRTRLVYNIGVAYGSDIDLVTQTLLEAAEMSPKVLHEPAGPSCFFMEFGASSLNFVLRVHVPVLADRMVTVHDINRNINNLCNARGIEIAFNQLDVFIKDGSGVDVKVDSKINKVTAAASVSTSAPSEKVTDQLASGKSETSDGAVTKLDAISTANS